MYKNITLYLNTLNIYIYIYIYIYKQKQIHRYSRWGGMGQAKSTILSSPS